MTISPKQVREFALALSVSDIVAYCEANREEYELFLQEEARREGGESAS